MIATGIVVIATLAALASPHQATVALELGERYPPMAEEDAVLPIFDFVRPGTKLYERLQDDTPRGGVVFSSSSSRLMSKRLSDKLSDLQAIVQQQCNAGNIKILTAYEEPPPDSDSPIRKTAFEGRSATISFAQPLTSSCKRPAETQADINDQTSLATCFSNVDCVMRPDTGGSMTPSCPLEDHDNIETIGSTCKCSKSCPSGTRCSCDYVPPTNTCLGPVTTTAASEPGQTTCFCVEDVAQAPPMQGSDMSQLSELAVHAGLDWVLHESSDAIRVSVLPDSCDADFDLSFVLDGSLRRQLEPYQAVCSGHCGVL